MRFLLIFVYFLCLFSFPGIIHAQTPADADAAARDALRRLESALGGSNMAPVVPHAPVPPAQVTRGGRQPSWVGDPYSVYNRNLFLAAVGSAANRDQAEARALAALVALFGQSIRSDFAMTTMYTEAVNRGVVRVSDNTAIRDQITTAASMDNLIGVEIGSIWDSRRGTVYAVAFMDRARTISMYTDLIILNNRNIETLTTLSDSQKFTFDGYARFKLASQIAGINSNYAAIISVLGGSTSLLNLRSADYYNLEAANIIRNTTIAINVENDRANRIQDAFAGVLAAEGFRTRGNNPAYTLRVNLNVSEVTFPNNNFIFCRIETSANLIDNSTGASLFPFSFEERSGHSTYANAETTAFRSAERIIAERFSVMLREYLASLTPRL